MNPDDFDCFVGGVDLTAANYSGGAGGTFTDLVTGAEDWTVQGNTPGFLTKSGAGWSLEGMNMAGVVGDTVRAKCPFLWEGTVVVIGQNAGNTAYLGGDYTAGNSWAMSQNSNRITFFNSIFGGWTSSAGFAVGAPNVLTISNCPETGKAYAQINDQATLVMEVANKYDARINWPTIALGRHRTTYMTGWIARALFFSRALHERDNDNLQLLIASEMERIGR